MQEFLSQLRGVCEANRILGNFLRTLWQNTLLANIAGNFLTACTMAHLTHLSVMATNLPADYFNYRCNNGYLNRPSSTAESLAHFALLVACTHGDSQQSLQQAYQSALCMTDIKQVSVESGKTVPGDFFFYNVAKIFTVAILNFDLLFLFLAIVFHKHPNLWLT